MGKKKTKKKKKTRGKWCPQKQPGRTPGYLFCGIEKCQTSVQMSGSEYRQIKRYRATRSIHHSLGSIRLHPPPTSLVCPENIYHGNTLSTDLKYTAFEKKGYTLSLACFNTFAIPSKCKHRIVREASRGNISAFLLFSLFSFFFKQQSLLLFYTIRKRKNSI